jgi:hypothetical protein
MPDFRGRLAIGLMSLLIAVGGLAVVIVAFLPTRGNGPVRQPTDQPIYTVTFPVEPVPVDGQAGHYALVIETNLPDGTLLDSEYADSLGEGGGCCSSVSKGELQIPLVNNHCTDNKGIPQGSDVKVTVIAEPQFGFFGNQQSAQFASRQPDDVLAVLGTDFENLNGPDVKTKGDTRVLVASQEYKLPPDSCVSPYSSH